MNIISVEAIELRLPESCNFENKSTACQDALNRPGLGIDLNDEVIEQCCQHKTINK